MAKVNDFLNPNSMLTPGIAGSITMMIANALWVNFGLEPKYTALLLCMLLGSVVLAELRVPLWQKPVYYIINVLIIFSVSAGTNIVGMSANDTNLATETTQVEEQQIAVSLSLPDISGLFFNNAMAAEVSSKKKNSTTVQNKMKPPSGKITSETAKLKLKPSVKLKKKSRNFFKSWF